MCDQHHAALFQPLPQISCRHEKLQSLLFALTRQKSQSHEAFVIVSYRRDSTQ